MVPSFCDCSRRATVGDGFRAAVELKRHDVAHRGLDQDVGWRHRQPVAGELVLNQTERAGQYIENGEWVGLFLLRRIPAFERGFDRPLKLWYRSADAFEQRCQCIGRLRRIVGMLRCVR